MTCSTWPPCIKNRCASRSENRMNAFEILLAWSDRILRVEPDETALQVLLREGIPIEPGCTLGGCGMCATEYVEGDLIHKDTCLSPADRENYFCPCVSRAFTRIVLAL